MLAYWFTGAAYLDFPGDMLSRSIAEEEIESPRTLLEPPKSYAESKEIQRAVELLQSAQKPLMIVGKGAAYSRSENVINQFAEMTNIPVLATPMGKGDLYH